MPVHIERLEQIVDQLAEADDWTGRLKDFLKDLRPDQRRAFSRLVSLGCVPHDLAYHIRQQSNEAGTGAERAAQRERSIYLPRLRTVAAMFQNLASECERYSALRENYGGSKFRLDRNISAFLRDEAAAIHEFIRNSDSRRHSRRGWADTQLRMMMRDVKITAGAFQDRLVAQVLDGISGRKWNEEKLKRWRAREDARWNQWTAPGYVNRPTTRIKLE